jgi:hypothetical protein
MIPKSLKPAIEMLYTRIAELDAAGVEYNANQIFQECLKAFGH